MLEQWYRAVEKLRGKVIGAGAEMRIDFAGSGFKDFFEKYGGEIKFGKLEDIIGATFFEVKNVLTKGMVQEDIRNRRLLKGVDTLIVAARRITPPALAKIREVLEEPGMEGKRIVAIEADLYNIQKSMGLADDLEKQWLLAVETHDVQKVVARDVEQLGKDIGTVHERLAKLDNIMENYTKAGIDLSSDVKEGLKEYREIYDMLKNVAGLDKIPERLSKIIEYFRPSPINEPPQEKDDE